ICEIRTAVTLGEFDPSLMIKIISPVVDYTVEEHFIEIRDMIIFMGGDVREMEGIGEKAFLVTDPEEVHHALVFIDADIDRIVFAGATEPEFDYEVAMDLAMQVEVNVR
ncbi:MAG: hypothetical protein LRZ96_01645, partial [Candidatus Pacebacteria bacterium]|nr:hypothetical protein [Candidatus Paceibacterota bacterium]